MTISINPTITASPLTIASITPLFSTDVVGVGYAVCGSARRDERWKGVPSGVTYGVPRGFNLTGQALMVSWVPSLHPVFLHTSLFPNSCLPARPVLTLPRP